MREMKDSGIAWIGEIPKNWKIKKIKNVICNDKDGLKIGPFGSALANKTIADGAYNIYGQANLVNDDFSCTKNTINKNTFHILKSYQVLPNDICLSMMGTIGKCKTVPVGIKEGIMDSHLIKIRLDKTQIISKFFEYVYDKDLSNICITEMQYVKKGSIMDGLNTSIVKNLRIVVPPVLDQQAIVAFLDAKCADIDSLVEDIQKQIEILKKYKKSVITQAITKGIDPNVEMKETVSPYWNEIPKKWYLSDIKYIFKIVKRIAGKEGYDILSVTQKGLKIKDVSHNEGQIAENYKGYQFVYPGDFVMNHMDLLTGWVDLSKLFGVTSPDYRVFKLRDNHVNEARYYKYVMQCCYSCRIFYSLGQGVSTLGRWRLQTSAFNNFLIPVPPITEQKVIADFLDSKCADIDAAIAGKQKQLDVLKEYKKSLIYEYVTGKKEVPCRE